VIIRLASINSADGNDLFIPASNQSNNYSHNTAEDVAQLPIGFSCRSRPRPLVLLVHAPAAAPACLPRTCTHRQQLAQVRCGGGLGRIRRRCDAPNGSKGCRDTTKYGHRGAIMTSLGPGRIPAGNTSRSALYMRSSFSLSGYLKPCL
jgi:hypothetical protein